MPPFNSTKTVKERQDQGWKLRVMRGSESRAVCGVREAESGRLRVDQ